MPAPPAGPLAGDEPPAAVTDAMAALHERDHHREPVAAKTVRLGKDDLLACVMGGVYTDAEKTMIEMQRSTIVQEPATPPGGDARQVRQRGPAPLGPAT